MKLFGRSKDKKTEEKEECEPEDDQDMVKVEKTEKIEKKYTEHEAVITYKDGSEEEVTFDKMYRNKDNITLADYKDLDKKGRFKKEKFMIIMDHDLRSFETVNREQKSFEYETTKKYEKPREEVEDDEEILEEV